MKLSTTAALITISSIVLSSPSSVSARNTSSMSTSKSSKGRSTSSMSTTAASKSSKGRFISSMSTTSKSSKVGKATKKAKSGSYSMSVGQEPCFRDLRFNCIGMGDTKDCNELTNSCRVGPFRFGCEAGSMKPGKEVCGRACHPDADVCFGGEDGGSGGSGGSGEFLEQP